MKHAVPLAALLVLAACSKPASQPAPTPSASPTPGAVPQKLQGRWGLTTAACDPTRAGPGLLTIGPDALAVNAAAEQVTRVIVRPDRIAIDTSATDGDTTASRRYELTPSPDGKTLTRNNDPRPALVYTRCPQTPS